MTEAEAPADRRLILAGAGSFVVEVTDVARMSGWEVVAWIEGLDRDRAAQPPGPGEPPLLWVDDQASFEPRMPIAPGIGSVKRAGLMDRLVAEGRELATVIHPSAVIAPSAVIESGCVIFPGVVIGARTTVGRGTIVNRGALIGHHTTIGAHCFLGPGANVAGLVTLEDEVTIALAAVVRDRVSVGRGGVVGAGAVAVTDVAAGMTVVGVPAKPMAPRG